jgi:GLPGLI family protein
MKKYILILIVFINTINGQNTLIKYSYETTFSKEDKEKEFIGEYIQAIERGAKLIELELIFNDSISVYRSLDVMNTNENDDVQKAKVGCSCSEDNYQFNNYNYKNNSTDFFPENKFLIKSEIENGWILLNETMKINNLLCYKAIRSFEKNLSNGEKTTIETIAWYCPEIKGNYGPAGFGNLPGIILFLQTGKNIFKAKEIIINSNKPILFEKKGIEITKQEYLNKVNELMNGD